MRKRHIAAIAIATLLVAAYAERGFMRDAYRSWQRGPIPPEVSRTAVIARSPKGDEAISKPPVIPAEAGIQKEKPPITPTPSVVTSTPSPVIPPSPSSFNLKLVFVPQAPLLNWDALHEDACEEASMLMIDAYLRDVPSYTPEQAEERIQKLVAAETAYGDGVSISAARVAELMRTELGIKTAKVVQIDSIDDVKKMIAAGHPLILPAAGKLLKNPNFKNGGPLYHMLVAKGYTATTIITNDPGTRHGENYAYDQDLLWNAIHDWNEGDVENGAKVMIIAD